MKNLYFNEWVGFVWEIRSEKKKMLLRVHEETLLPLLQQKMRMRMRLRGALQELVEPQDKDILKLLIVPPPSLDAPNQSYIQLALFLKRSPENKLERTCHIIFKSHILCLF